MLHQDGLKDDGAAGTAPKEEENPLTRELRRDPQIAAALDGGDGERLWNVLRAKRKSTQPGPLRAAIERALSERRNFLMPLGGAPSMASLNGVGTRLYGRANYDQNDQTYVGTLFFVIVFLPIYPIRQYLVRDAGHKAYNFFGRIPFDDTMRIWRRVVRLGLLAGILAILGGAYYTSNHSTVYFVNGLDVPLNVTVDRELVAVAAGGHESRSLEKGRHKIEVRGVAKALPNELVEIDQINVPRNTDAVVYNILGAAPMFLSEVIYSTAPSADEKGAFENLSGEKFIVRDGVEYVFQKPPESISMDQHASNERRHHLDMDSRGWKVAAVLLASQGKIKEAAAMAARVAEYEPDDLAAHGLSVHLAEQAGGLEAALLVVKRWTESAPGSVEAHRMFQDLMIRAGRRDELLASYRLRFEKQPESAAAGYLLARVESPEVALPLYASLAKKFPEDSYVQRGYSWELHLQRRFPEALVHFEKYAAISGDPLTFLNQQAADLVALGRAGEAIERTVSVADGLKNGDAGVATLYAQLVRKVGADHAPHPGDYYFSKWSKEIGEAKSRLLYIVNTGVGEMAEQDLASVKEEAARAGLEINQLGPIEPARALDRVRAAPAEALLQIEPCLSVMLACESLRLGDAKTSEKLAESFGKERNEGDILLAAVQKGEHAPRFGELPLELQAAVRFVSGRAATSASERARLFDLARKDDPLGGFVTRAMDHWPIDH